MAASRMQAAENLRRFVTSRTGSGVYTFQRLLQVAEGDESPPGETDVLDVAKSVADLVVEGLLEQFVVVESPSGKGGVAEFASIRDVPERLHDLRTDLEIDVAPENLRVMYRLPKSSP